MIATPEYLQGSALWHRYQSEGLLQIRPAPVCAVAEKVMPDVRNPQLTLCQERRSALSLRLFPIGRPRAAAEKCTVDIRNDNRSALKLTLFGARRTHCRNAGRGSVRSGSWSGQSSAIKRRRSQRERIWPPEEIYSPAPYRPQTARRSPVC